jgi:glycosyltransferase involved in cell wall biosynthesis
MVSIIILTKNEAQDLPSCLDSLRWCDDVIVLDSGSTDETVALAQKSGARIFHNPFKSFGDQRNWALDHCAPKHAWILFLDADELSTPEFQSALLQAIQHAPAEVAGYYCCWKMMYRGVWLKRSDSFPKWQLRLLRAGRVRFIDFGHGQKEGDVQGRLEYLREPYLHYAMSKGMRAWLDRHNKYSDQEAAARAAEAVNWRNIFSRHGSVRNRALKPLVSRLPGWPLFRFAWPYLFKLGFLEGRSGLTYCVNLAYYEWLIQAKMREARDRANGVRI